MEIKVNQEVVRKYGLNKNQVENLITLATFLDRTVPPPTFDIGTFVNTTEYFQTRVGGDLYGFNRYFSFKTVLVDRSRFPRLMNSEVYNHCGTTACAVGHGPLAGIKGKSGENWHNYCRRAFGLDSFIDPTDEAWYWCFSDTWRFIDNTPAGAAARIKVFLEDDVPEDGIAQRHGNADLSYVIIQQGEIE